MRFPSGELLLLSEREADAILALAWRSSAVIALPWGRDAAAAAAGTSTRAGASSRLAFLNFFAARGDMPAVRASRPALSEAELNLGALQLFNGEVRFSAAGSAREAATARKAAVAALLPSRDAKDAAPKMAAFRGARGTLEYSDLERICRA